MRLGHKPNEFAAFTDSVRAQLTKLGALPEHHTILVNSVSGLPWPAETDRIGTLTIVKATIDRPARTGYDYLLWARTICCLGQEPTPTNVGTPVVKVTSPSGVFDATIFQQR